MTHHNDHDDGMAARADQFIESQGNMYVTRRALCEFAKAEVRRAREEDARICDAMPIGADFGYQCAAAIRARAKVEG